MKALCRLLPFVNCFYIPLRHHRLSPLLHNNAATSLKCAHELNLTQQLEIGL